MKKLLALALSIIMIGAVFYGCSSDKKKTDSKKNETTVSETTVSQVSQIETKNASISGNDAIDFISEAYSKEELGLDDTKEEYSMMVASTGVEIDGKKYVKVVANVKTKSDVTTKDGGETFYLKSIGEYYISFDGETILMKNKDTKDYKKLENRYKEYSSSKNK